MFASVTYPSPPAADLLLWLLIIFHRNQRKPAWNIIGVGVLGNVCVCVWGEEVGLREQFSVLVTVCECENVWECVIVWCLNQSSWCPSGPGGVGGAEGRRSRGSSGDKAEGVCYPVGVLEGGPEVTQGQHPGPSPSFNFHQLLSFLLISSFTFRPVFFGASKYQMLRLVIDSNKLMLRRKCCRV